MTEDEAEEVARQATVESGLDDRPRCDPRVLAVSYLGLRLVPRPRARPRLVGSLLWYPSDAPESAQAYYVAHECGHDLLRDMRLSPDVEEAAASRIGVALMLPQRAFLRDVRDCRGHLGELARLWPLATRTVIARRMLELLGPHHRAGVSSVHPEPLCR